MVTFKQFVTELFDSKYKWKFVPNGANWMGFFEDKDGKKVDVLFDQFPKGTGVWEIEFERDGDYGMTGGGDALKIFSTVLEMIEELVHREKPQYLSFSAKKDEPSRVKFYDRYAKKMEKFGYKDVTDDLKGVPENLARYVRSDTHAKRYFLVRK